MPMIEQGTSKVDWGFPKQINGAYPDVTTIYGSVTPLFCENFFATYSANIAGSVTKKLFLVSSFASFGDSTRFGIFIVWA